MAQSSVAACTYHISGSISDADTGEQLWGAHLHLSDNRCIAVSDSAGNYSISNLCSGTYTVSCSHLGCAPLVQTVFIHNSDIRLDFLLPHHEYELAAATIKAARTQPLATQAQSTLSAQELLQKRGESLGDALLQISGVSALQSGSNVVKPVINGLHSQRIVILNNGVRQEGQQWGQDHAPEIDPFTADQLSVVKGASGVRYGSDAIAGVILVEPKPLRYDKGTDGELTLAAFSNGRTGVVSGRINANLGFLPQFAWRLQGTLKRGGNLHTPDYYLKNTGISEYNFSYQVGYKKDGYASDLFYSQYNADIGIFTGSHVGNLTDLQNAIASLVPLVSADFSYAIDRPRQRAEHETIKWSNRFKIEHIGSLSLDITRQFNRRSEYDARRPYNDSLAQTDPPQLRFTLQTYTADLVFEHRAFKKWAGSMGLSGMWQKNRYSGVYFIPNYTAYNGGIWAMERRRWQKYELEIGLRYDMRHLHAKTPNPTQTEQIRTWHNLSANIGASYRPNKQWRLSVNSGLAWRPPHVSELLSKGVHHGAASFEIGNPDLQPEHAYNTIAALQYQNEQTQFNISAFCNYINNYTCILPVLPPTLTIRGAFPTFRYDQTDALLLGTDLSGSLPIYRQWSAWAKAAVLHPRDLKANTLLPLMPPDRAEIGWQYALKDGKQRTHTQVKMGAMWVAQSPYDDTLDYAPPPAAYWLLNATASSTWQWGKHHLNLSLNAQNILNTRYRDYLNRLRYFADEIGTNISLKINWVWGT